jgi:NADPH:quinone reductase-like Zn-dependent oxidoreductase
MEAFALEAFGSSGSVRQLPDPAPEAGQVLVRVAAAGLNPFDSAVINGNLEGRMEHRFPLVPGMDGSGRVEAIGDGVDGFDVGSEVFGSVGKPYLGGGTLAGLTTMSTGTIARRPAVVHADVAATIPVAGVTAYTMADELGIERDHALVAIGATGGVGSFFVQLAAKRGARVVAVCSGENAAYARALGAADVVDYTAGDVVDAITSAFDGGIDAVADMHGDAELVRRLAEHVHDGGHVVSVVGAVDDALASRPIVAKNVSGTVNTSTLETLIGMVERDEIITPPIHPFRLSDAATALERVGSHHVRGKIVVEIDAHDNAARSAPTRGGSNVPNAARDSDEGRTE